MMDLWGLEAGYGLHVKCPQQVDIFEHLVWGGGEGGGEVVLFGEVVKL